MPEPGPFGETFFEASDRAMVAASLVKSPSGGKVEAVLSRATQRRLEGRFDLEDGLLGLRREDFVFMRSSNK
jgi:hypothetical protein